MDQPTMNMLQQITKLTCNHPTLMSISLDIFAIRLDSPIIYHVANVPYLKEIRVTASKIPSSTMEILFEKATSLERITLWASPLTLTETMFIALAKLRLRELNITSAGMQGTTMNATGLRHFIDHHAGALDKITITGNIIPDDDSQCITYGDQKLGNRFKYDKRLLF
ncbi:hypothetical protein K492DRAFT_174505 [Lichtheimia hyalospora FSU 10163]|nr:hypothetical protein K492DRAFT_174505 [Lichtheimia hyalospora FSU 10163]